MSALECLGLKGKSILVTGSGRGIGRGIALKLGEAGACVGVTYTGSNEKSEANAKAVCAEIEKLGGRAIAVALDVSNEDQVNDAIKKMVEAFGGLYGVVNNAGIVIDQLLLRYKSEDWDKVLDTNLKGAFLVSKAAAKYLMKAGGASIVNMTSVVGEMGAAGQAPYSASKAGLIGLSKSLARELASRQVRVNCIAPGFIATDMTEQLNDAQKEAILGQVPLNSLGSVDDIAWGTLYLLSPTSRYVTGQVLSINGGLYM